jgi:hypothetical protein
VRSPLPPLLTRLGGGLASIRMRKKATFDSNRKARSERSPATRLSLSYRVSQPKMSSPKMSSHLKMLSNENLSTPRGDWKEKDSLLLLVFYGPNPSKYKKKKYQTKELFYWIFN